MKLLVKSTLHNLSCIVLGIFIFTFCGLDKEANQIENHESKTTVKLEEKNEKDISLKRVYKYLLINDTTKSYNETIKEVEKIKKSIDIDKIGLDSISILFSDLLVKRIIPYWYGTGWSFEGHTSIPQQGTIACGYFVSTTLKHMGLNLNRYRLAQQSPINEAKSLSLGSELIEINEATTEECINKIRKLKLKDGIYFLGFDEGHVGYLYKEGEKLFVIHSNFFCQEGVEVENIEDSETSKFFNRFYIGEISTNEKLLRKWLTDDKIGIVSR